MPDRASPSDIREAIQELSTAQGHAAMAIAHMELAMDHLPKRVPVNRQDGDIGVVALRDMIRNEQQAFMAHGKSLDWIERELQKHA